MKANFITKQKKHLINCSIHFNCKNISYICVKFTCHQMSAGSCLPVVNLVPPGASPVASTPETMNTLPISTICKHALARGRHGRDGRLGSLL